MDVPDPERDINVRSSRKETKVTDGPKPAPEDLARKRAKAYTALMWHIGVFVIINAFFWILDLVTGIAGLQWAYWITIFWGLALAFHVVAYLVGDSGLEERKYRKTLAEE